MKTWKAIASDDDDIST